MTVGATGAGGTVLASIPSPEVGVWYLGPIPIRAYAFAIIIGIIVAVLIGQRRWEARGGDRNQVVDISLWAVPFGILGARIYHVISSPEAYFGENGNPWAVFRIWEGGLGIWGGIAFGVLGAWIGARRVGVKVPPFADALAPGIMVAQAIGRLGNYFNQELYGKPSDLPWAVEISPENRPPDMPDVETYHPTFLYEALWNLGVAGVVVWADRRFRLGHGRAFALYVALYCAGRVWIESLRIDPANTFFGVRLNVFSAIVVGLAAVIFLLLTRGPRWRRETPAELYREGRVPPELLEGDGSGEGVASGKGVASDDGAASGGGVAGGGVGSDEGVGSGGSADAEGQAGMPGQQRNEA